jgi:hypothetical protein
MPLLKLGRKAIESRRLDADTVRELHRVIDRKRHLNPEEYELLRSLARAVKVGEVERRS